MKWEIGVRAHDFGRMQLSELAPRIADAGFSHVQLALGKALNDFQYTCGILSNGLAHSIERELSRNNLRPSVIGCYINPAEENTDALQANIKMFKEHIRFAREMGCKIVATETGYIIPDSNEEISRNLAFDRVIRFVSEVTEEAEKFGVLVAIEAVYGHTINTPRAMDRMFGLIPSNNLCALVDVVNMIHPAEASRQIELVNEAFNLYRERINVFHMKDFKIAGTAKESAVLGQGELNLAYHLNKIKEEKPYADIILEEVKPDKASEARELVSGLLGQ
jgi:L-ribulose-5-phosphate 3-epimerase